MIHKSYLVEENLDLLRNSIVLIYGENIGLLDDFKKKISEKNKKNAILKFSQEDILKNENIFFDEIKNDSLFDEKKIFFIDNVSDKFLKIIIETLPIINNNLIYLYTNILEKKSALRNFFEKEKKTDIVPCYQDNEMTLRKIVKKSLDGYDVLTDQIIDLIMESCSKDRRKIKNEIGKIKTFFNNTPLNYDSINKLLNYKEDENFNFLRDYAVCGDKKETGKLLYSTNMEAEKSIYYLSSINKRLTTLKEIIKYGSNIEKSINEIRPPIFWKDKSTLLTQAKKWNIKKLDQALNMTLNTEITIKTNSNFNKNIIIKKLILDIYNLANAA